MPYGFLLEAEYSDGFTLRETSADASLWVVGKNTFHDIEAGHAVARHGPMVRYTLHGPDRRYDIDWRTVPDNAEPVCFREMQSVLDMDTSEHTLTMKRFCFGYKYVDNEGNKVTETEEVL